MAQFEGVQWAGSQMRYMLDDKTNDYLESDARVFAVSRSLHYGLFLAFEGIRFFADFDENNKLEVVFMNWDRNLKRFRRGIAFNLGESQQHMVPGEDELVSMFLDYFKQPVMIDFLKNMAESGAQGYLRPFTVDEEQSIGVTFPSQPAIRAVVCRYDRYLGEPFDGVVVPTMVRAPGINETGCLKLGINYLMSVKAVDLAKQIRPSAASALFLDDNPWMNLRDRVITEWDSSCCLFAFDDGSVLKIPESNLILPSVTIGGTVSILRDKGITVNERDITYGELIDRANEIVAVCSIGTAGILNRCDTLVMIDNDHKTLATQTANKEHDLYKFLGEIKDIYWGMFKGTHKPCEGMTVKKYAIE